MNRLVLRGALALGMVGILCAVRLPQAEACSCLPPDLLTGTPVLLPSNGAVVPAQVHVWLQHREPELIGVFDAAGDEVAVTRETLRVRLGMDVQVLTPVSPLPEGEYSVRGGGAQLSRFSVDDDAVAEPPATPQLVDVVREASDEDDSCGATPMVILRFESDGLLLARLPDLRHGDYVIEDPGGEVGEVVVPDRGGATLSFGGACGAVWPFPEDDFEIQVAAVDASGGFSGWSEPMGFRRPSTDGGDCSVGTLGEPSRRGGAAGVTLLIAVCVAAWRARGRARPPRHQSSARRSAATTSGRLAPRRSA